MSNRIRETENVHVAFKMLGKYNEQTYVVEDYMRDKRNLNPYNIDDKILIYERQVKKWFLDKATRLATSEQNDFIVLMVCMSYLEGIEQMKVGTKSENSSKQFFVNSVNRLYPNKFNEESLKRLYKESRCGLFHNGMTGGDVIVCADFPASIEFRDIDILISPKKLLMDIKTNFDIYIRDLQDKNNQDLRENFDKMFVIAPSMYVKEEQ